MEKERFTHPSDVTVDHRWIDGESKAKNQPLVTSKLGAAYSDKQKNNN